MASKTVFVVTCETWYGVVGVLCEKCQQIFKTRVFLNKEDAERYVAEIKPCDCEDPPCPMNLDTAITEVEIE